ncbi:hypothetical protein NEMBOFW57_007940 [Staphylotrichum longicolle]|uniref:Uncharacterized protein n=1 Tax=Staphylotrichum longicolle TaxID=669026 RepID=A0AAD4I0W5_9PEZI|nr:hypothetical protein NEMBOFW57_007940 [Staphylotrichum longicolle]
MPPGLRSKSIWALAEAYSGGNMEGRIIGGIAKVTHDPPAGMDLVRRALTIWRWHHERLPLGRPKTVVNHFRELIREAERHYERIHNGRKANALLHFDAWFQIRLEVMKDRLETWGLRWTSELLMTPAIINVPAYKAIAQNLDNAYRSLDEIDTTGFYSPLP